MKFRTLVLSFACLAVATAAPAQDTCPKTRAVEVAARGTLGPDRACDTGFDVRIQDVRLTTGRKSCPLFAVVTPTHHDAVAAKERTYANVYGTVSEQIVYFDCTPHYFLFFHLNSSCDVRSIVNAGSLQMMETKGCVDAATVP